MLEIWSLDIRRGRGLTRIYFILKCTIHYSWSPHSPLVPNGNERPLLPPYYGGEHTSHYGLSMEPFISFHFSLK